VVRREGIEPPSVPCKGTALPLDERREIWAGGRELNPILLFHRQLCAPVHYPLHWYHRQESNLVLGLRRAV
jgi:hypothetical protein